MLASLRRFAAAVLLVSAPATVAGAGELPYLTFRPAAGVAELRFDEGQVLLRDSGVAGRWAAVVQTAGRIELQASRGPATRKLLPADILSDGEVTLGDGEIAAAWLAGATERYGHGVLGDAIEASVLVVRRRDGGRSEVTLSRSSVFEDRFPRLGDIDGDGEDDIVVVRSYLTAGAAVSAWSLRGGQLVGLAESPAIGRPNRWLNPVGIADFDGDGRPEVAVVITPHIGGRLTLFEHRDGALVADGAADGFSNHAIGSRELRMSAILKTAGGIAIALPGADRRSLRIVSFHAGHFAEWHRVQHDRPISSAIVAADIGGDGAADIVYATDDGVVVAVDGAGIGPR